MKTSEPGPESGPGTPAETRVERRARERGRDAGVRTELEEDFVSSWHGSMLGRRPSIVMPVRGLRGIGMIAVSVGAVVAVVFGAVLAVRAAARPDDPVRQNASLSAVQMSTTQPATAPTTPALTATPAVKRGQKARKPASPSTRTVTKTVASKADPSPSPAPKPRKATTKKTTSTKAASAVPVADSAVNLASSRPVQAGDHVQNLVESNVTDGDVNTYWEAEPSFPQTITVDLGSLQTVGRLVLALPTGSDWNSRTQTIAVLGSRDGGSYRTLKAAAGYTFDANSASADQVSASFAPAPTRYLRLTFTANSGWSAAQLSELEAHSS